MDDNEIAEARALRGANPAEWHRRYVSGLDGWCQACRAGQPILYRYVSDWGIWACHVHSAPAWVPLDAPAPAHVYGRSLL